MVPPWAMVPSPATVQDAQVPTVHDALANEPESTPFVQVRVSDAHAVPQATDEVE